MISEATKSPYEKPSLVEYGSVRNLTGGSTGTNGDGGSSKRVMA